MNKKKFMSLILALVMMIGAFSPLTTMASNGNTPISPKLDGKDVSTTKPDKTKLYVHKLSASSFNVGEGIKHNGGKLSADDIKKLVENGKEAPKAINGVKFKYYKITDDKKFADMVKNPGNYKTEDKMTGFTGTEATTATIGGEKGILSTDGQNVLELEEGNYWFIETGYEKDTTDTDAPDNISSYIAVPFGITLPLTNTVEVTKENKVYQPGTIWLTNVHTYPKNVTGKESIPKKTVGNEKNLNETHNVGDEQTWFLQATIPANIKDYESITMRDVFFKGLTYKGLEEVYFGFDGMDENDKVKLEATDYDLTQPAVDKKFTTEIPNPVTVPSQAPEGEEFKLVLKEGSKDNKVGIAKIAEKYEAMKAKADAKGEEVKVYAKVKTVINEDAKISTDIPNTFDLKVKIKGQPESKPKEPDQKPYVKTGGKKFKKVDKANQQVLEDAVFTIKHKVGGETAPTEWTGNDVKDLVWTQALIDANKEAIKAGKFAIKTADKEEYIKTSETASTTDPKSAGMPTVGSVIYIRSGSDGTFEIKGLEYSKNTIVKWDKDTKKFENDYVVYNHYALKEVKAPQDYALIKEEQGFTIDDTSYFKTANQVNAEPADPKIVENKKLEIPQTGGIGTVIFTVVGISLMAGAFIAMRKRTAEEN